MMDKHYPISGGDNDGIGVLNGMFFPSSLIRSPYETYWHRIGSVPEGLRKLNERAYVPKAVSVGPLNNECRRGLLKMEKIKWDCAFSLLCRGQENTGTCMELIQKLEEKIRESYSDKIKVNSEEFGNILLIDSCFLLELLISGSENWNKELPSRSQPPGPGARVGKREDVLSDLILLENQIPLFILCELSLLLFPRVFTKERGFNIIKVLALTLLGYSFSRSVNSTPESLDVHHFQELVHSSVPGAKKLEDNEDSDVLEKVEAVMGRCATVLQAAGVIIEPTPPECSFNFGIEFRNGTLKIPRLHITGTTEVKWRNFIAWEYHQMNLKNGSGSIEEGSGSTTTFKCKFIWAALFFGGLICCPSDVQLLKDKHVIVDHLEKKMSNQDLVTFFRSIRDGVDRSFVDPNDSHLFDALNRYYSSPTNRITAIPIRLWHYYRGFPQEFARDLLEFFTKGYNFAAAVITVASFLQTVYSVLSYYHSNK